MLIKKTGRTWFIIYLLVFHDIGDRFPIILSVESAEFPFTFSNSYDGHYGDENNLTLHFVHKRHVQNLQQPIDLTNSKRKTVRYTSLEERQDSDTDTSVAVDNTTLRWDSCFFDCKDLNTYLNAKKGPIWIVPKFLNAFLRGIAQVIITNNPITGLLMLIGIFWSDFDVGLLTSLATCIAILTAWFIGQDNDSIQNGLTTYNAVLVGSATSTLWKALYAEPITPQLIGMVIFGSVLSVFVNSGMGNILEHWDLPTLTLPFNIVASILLVVFKPPLPTSTSKELSADSDSDAEVKRSFNHLKVDPNSTALAIQQLVDENLNKFPHDKNVMYYMKDVYVGLEWWKVLKGIIYSGGQVWAVQTIPGSILIYLGILIYSPIAFTMALIGATVGTLTALIWVTEPPYTSVYTGIWGYNGILTGIAVGGFFFPLNEYSFLMAFVDTLLVTFIQQALASTFTPANISAQPVLTFPFCLGAYIFIAVTTREGYLTRVIDFSYPEQHRREYLKILAEKRLNKTLMGQTVPLTNTNTNQRRSFILK